MSAVTSVEALASIDITDLERRVLEVICAHGADGCISDDVRAFFEELSYSSVTARFAALEEKGLICRNGDTRPGKSKRQQQVMRDAKYAIVKAPSLVTPNYSPFERAIIYSARLLAKSESLADAKAKMAKEILKIKARHTK